MLGVNNLFDVYPDKIYVHPRNNPNNFSVDAGHELQLLASTTPTAAAFCTAPTSLASTGPTILAA
ncbi:MAG: hypothetical protein WKG07_26995 [Hymenobacter sp.]